MPEYWVYENWTHKRARLHLAECSFCNRGRGIHSEDSGRNGQWHGPFADKPRALEVLPGTKLADRMSCSVCAP